MGPSPPPRNGPPSDHGSTLVRNHINLNHINCRINHKTGVAPITGGSGVLLVEDCEKAEAFSSYFATIGVTDNGLTPPSTEHGNISTNDDSSVGLSSVHFDSIVVSMFINTMNVKSAPGPDGLFPIAIKNLSQVICEPLSYIFNLILQTGCVPSDWRKSTVVPIFKKGSASKVKNYRPISLTCSCCKLFESIVEDTLLTFLSSNNSISSIQHGFIARHSTCTNLLETFNDWTDNLDKSCDSLVVFVDFAKAFDCVHSKVDS